ncbi:TOM (translocase of outer membrane) complex component, partial [Oleoguttula sp. CCFEE 5521]
MANPSGSIVPSASTWDRLTAWYGENKVVAWTIAGVTVVAVGGSLYYLSASPAQKDTASSRPSSRAKKSKKKAKADLEKAETGLGKEEEDVSAGAKAEDDAGFKTAPPKPAVVEESDELPEITEESVGTLSESQRKECAGKLKAAGNKAYGSKDYNKAIDLYGQAILCKADAVFYSNRAACWNAMSNWEKVIEDTTAAINIDPEYVKALNRRANAY